MKVNIFLKLLLFLYTSIGVLGIIAYIMISEQTDTVDSFDVTYLRYTQIDKADDTEDTEADGVSTSDNDQLLLGENITADNSKNQEEFVADAWLDKIADYNTIVNEAANEQQNDDADTTENDSNEYIFNFDNMSKLVTSVIIDTDFASDCDDVVALRLAMCFQDIGMLDVKGIALSTTYSRSPLAVHALCKQDGYGSIPVAMDTSGNGVQVYTNYVDAIYDMPKDRDDYEQPVQMYRRLLAESDTKVNIITLGFLQNIQGLMNSPPDQYSSLTGMELIAEKVDTLYVVGGDSTGRPSFNFYGTGEKVVKSAQDVTRNFPADIVFLQTDLSDDTFCGQIYGTEDTKQQDIVTKALVANKQSGGVVAWDVFSVWCAVQDMNGNIEQSFLEKQQGNQYISDTGASEWTPNDFSNRYRIVKNVEGAYYSELLNNMLRQKYNSTFS